MENVYISRDKRFQFLLEIFIQHNNFFEWKSELNFMNHKNETKAPK